jgi:ATP-binding protein involved in chromosome partitioning
MPHQPGQAAPGPQPLPGVDAIIAVGSGKGGVGKTTLSVNLAVALAKMGHKVGLLDADVYGPNVPLMLGVSGQPKTAGENRIQPLEAFGLKVISVGFLNPGDKPIIWRGPMLHQIVKQFLGLVEWGHLDYMVVDLPPGTGDIALSLVQSVPLTGARGREHELFYVSALQPRDRYLLARRRGEDGGAFQRAVSREHRA